MKEIKEKTKGNASGLWSERQFFGQQIKSVN